jgi:serine/threonine-protein kinase
VSILAQVCRSLAEAHDAGLVHRDIKPGNILVCRYGRECDFVKVLDFGQVALAPEQQSEDPTRLTVGGCVGGTPAYTPPEMGLGAPVDGRSDLYSLGCVAFWLLTGRTVFSGANPMAMIVGHLNQTPEPPSRFAPAAIPEDLDCIVLDCLEKDPDRRPVDADELLRRLEACPVDEPWTQAHARRWWHAEHPETAADKADRSEVKA